MRTEIDQPRQGRNYKANSEHEDMPEVSLFFKEAEPYYPDYVNAGHCELAPEKQSEKNAVT